MTADKNSAAHSDYDTDLYTELYTQLAARMKNGLVAHLGIELVAVRPGYLCAQMEIMPHHIAANGYLHAGSVVTLADSACGFGCFASLPTGANSFTTIELKSNFLRTTTAGIVRAEARLVHGGQRTHVWDATVYDAKERALALFRCTQMLLYPQPAEPQPLETQPSGSQPSGSQSSGE